MSSESAISAHRVSKVFKLGLTGRKNSIMTILRQRLHHPVGAGARRERFRALDDVTFDVARGEVVGVIGRNGAGKSTLLKILSRITPPTDGYVELRGRVGSLLEVGTGFHPELTGLENVYLNGAVLGMTRKAIDRQLDSIVDFAGVHQFMDTPVKRYSSGMRVRLAFAVAAHLDTDILIIDEVLSVGDYSFQAKCLEKMRTIANDEGRTALYVSHNLVTVQNLCPRTIVLDAGRVIHDGDTDEAISTYLHLSPRGGAELTPGVFDLTAVDRSSIGNVPPVFRRIRLRSDSGPPSDVVRIGDRLRIEIDVELLDADATVHVMVGSAAEPRLIRMSSSQRPLNSSNGRTSSESIVVDVPALPLTPGEYHIDLYVYSSWSRLIDQVLHAAEFTVIAADLLGNGYEFTSKDGVFVVPWQWEVRPARDCSPARSYP